MNRNEPPSIAIFFKRGKAWVDRELYNGAYYSQKIDMKDRNILKPFQDDPQVFASYWNEEANELKYQIGDGCSIDQVLAQWHANLCGQVEIFDPEQTLSALKSIYRNNFKRNLRESVNPCRLFALQDEGGVVICEWPNPHDRPRVPLTYAEECMNGFEYQVAAHMVQSGMVREGVEIVRAIRHRYDGERRNPWNEFECGSNYARSMASYTHLLAFSGFTFDMTKGLIGFSPIVDDSSSFWALHSGWGEYLQSQDSACLSVLYGSLKIQEISLRYFAGRACILSMGSALLDSTSCGDRLVLSHPLVLSAGQTLEIHVDGRLHAS